MDRGCALAGDSAGGEHLEIDFGDKRVDVVQPGNKYFVAEGSHVSIQCKATTAENAPSASWTKVNTADWSKEKVGSDSSLVLNRVSASDAGRYDCVAHTLTNQSIELFVSSKRRYTCHSFTRPPVRFRRFGPAQKGWSCDEE